VLEKGSVMESVLTHDSEQTYVTRSTATDAAVGHGVATGLCCNGALDQHMRCSGHHSMLGSYRFETRPVGH
jgi:hypothetical protein